MHFAKTCSILAAAAMVSSFALGGCAAKKTITSENAPNDIMKGLAKITSESSAEDVTSALAKVITKTAEAYDYQIGYSDTGEGNTLDLEDGSIKTVPMHSKSYDYRVTDDNSTVYEFLDQTVQDNHNVGFMKADNKAITTAYTSVEDGTPSDPSMTFKLEDFETEDQVTEYSADEIADVVKNTAMIPMFSYLGADLIISPTSNPDFYDYSLVQEGANYTFTFKIADVDKFNEYLDNYSKDTYNTERTDLLRDGSIMADEYTTERVEISMTMNEEGVISKITNSNYSKVKSSEDQTDDVYYDEDIRVFKAPGQLKDSIKNFFNELSDKKIKKGDTFTVSFEDSAEKESADSAKKTEANETENTNQEKSENSEANNKEQDNQKADNSK
ncbi:hypothetical protein AAK979_02635 [Ileibacterium valens]|uniref:hypothetical protein n=1 Tax=Ileibacterium valens TaxID=1862668 RepID=UPI003517E3E8